MRGARVGTRRSTSRPFGAERHAHADFAAALRHPVGHQSVDAAGLQQGLHTEGFELSMVDGKRVFDMLSDLLDPQLVKFQFQMSTITSGLVAADYFTAHPNRFISMHLQDLDIKAPVPPPAPAAPGDRAGRGGGRPQKPIGQGSIDWVMTFRAAKTGGVQNYFIEMNEQLMRESVPYLKVFRRPMAWPNDLCGPFARSVSIGR